MKTLIALSATFGLLAVIACSNEEFSGLPAVATQTAVPACTSGTTYDTASNSCLATATSTPTTTTPTPTATPTTATATPSPTPSGSCAAGEVESDSYGCIPLGNCSDGQGWYQNQCITLHGHPMACRDFCPIGMTNTPHGCLPQIPECPPCTGVAHGLCFWGVDYLDWWYGH